MRPVKCKLCTESKDISLLPCLHIDDDGYPSEVPSKSRKRKERSSGQCTGTGVSSKNAHILDVKLIFNVKISRSTVVQNLETKRI